MPANGRARVVGVRPPHRPVDRCCRSRCSAAGPPWNGRCRARSGSTSARARPTRPRAGTSRRAPRSGGPSSTWCCSTRSPTTPASTSPSPPTRASGRPVRSRGSPCPGARCAWCPRTPCRRGGPRWPPPSRPAPVGWWSTGSRPTTAPAMPSPAPATDPVASPAPPWAWCPRRPSPRARTGGSFPDAVVAEGTRTQIAVYNPGGRTRRGRRRRGPRGPRPLPRGRADPAHHPAPVRAGGRPHPGGRHLPDVAVLGRRPLARRRPGGRRAALVLRCAPSVGRPTPPTPATAGQPTSAATGRWLVTRRGAGAPVAATTWFLASRGSSSLRAATVVVANPGVRRCEVEVTELTDAGHGRSCRAHR